MIAKTKISTGPAPTDPELDVRRVSHQFQRLESSEPFLALQDIDLSVKRGKFLAIIGRSGCGKSTLLRIVAGLLNPTDGLVLQGGDLVHGPHYSRGFVFQADAVFPWLTVRENIEFGLRSRGFEKKKREEISTKWAGIVGLSEFINAYPKELSGGMRKRVDLARVYANDPAVLLMDEPFGALDAQTKERMQTELLAMWEQSGKTVMFITHDVDEAIFLADEVVIMSSWPGEIAAKVSINLPRARTEETRVSDEFSAYRRSIRRTMQALDREDVAK